MPTVYNFNKMEKSLLLYLESRAVDNAGKIDSRQINEEDRLKIAEWVEDGFIESGRIAYSSISNRNESTWVKLSNDAHREAARLRKERAARAWEGRRYLTTEERRGIDV